MAIINSGNPDVPLDVYKKEEIERQEAIHSRDIVETKVNTEIRTSSLTNVEEYDIYENVKPKNIFIQNEIDDNEEN